MKTMSYTQSRARYAEVLDSVVADREQVVITRAGHEPVVIVSLADFGSLRETAYLMRSPANANKRVAWLIEGSLEASTMFSCSWVRSFFPQ